MDRRANDYPGKRIYFDWAAAAIPGDSPSGTIPFGNPSSKHTEGREAREALEGARSRCAAALGVPAKGIYFTSGATESNAMVIHSLFFSRFLRTAGDKTFILVSAIEHPSVGENAARLERLGARIGLIGCEEDGRVTVKTLGRALEKYPEARFAAIMAVNNETGSVMDMPALASLLRSRKGPPIHLHCDMVQAAGKIPVNLRDWDIDSASVSAHKIGGPRGIGLLYLRRSLEPLYAGGGQEGNLRPGTENTAGALALADNLERRIGGAAAGYKAAALRWKELIRALGAMGRCILIPRDRGEEDPRFSPYILQAAFEGVPGEVMVRALDEAGFAVSTGSACSAASRGRPVLAAMGVDEAAALGGIRISQGWTTTGGDIGALTAAIQGILRTFRGAV